MKKTISLLLALLLSSFTLTSIAQSVSLPQASLSSTPLGTVENNGNAIATINFTESSGTSVPSEAFGEPNVSISINFQYIELRDANINAITGSVMDYFLASYDQDTNILLLEQKEVIPGDWSGSVDFPIAVIQNSTQAESFNGFNANIAAIDKNTNAEGNASIFTYTNESVLSIDDVGPLKFEVTPNPTNGIFNINFDKNTNATVELFDLSGKFISSKKYKNLETISLNIESLASAVYLLKVTSGVATDSVRVIKQ